MTNRIYLKLKAIALSKKAKYVYQASLQMRLKAAMTLVLISLLFLLPRVWV
ncbi:MULTISPECIES: hypothetical protein [unclassified Nostoc]|uniref:hypothetical protein n=1 Tax=unclassified Nostoc TaxID=2593658 RepID=UPI001CB895B2|nr:hypothetical protein [Nostoc sp. 'Peltigera membranacea cyanobiont' 232]